MSLRSTLRSCLMLLCVWVASPVIGLGGGRMTPERLWELGRIGEAQLSPDGSQLLYTLNRYDLAENAGATDLVLMDVAGLASALSAALSSEPSGEAAAGEAPLVAAAFGTGRWISPGRRVLLEGIRGLNSIAWINRPEGLRIVYLAPGQGEGDASDESAQVWILDPVAAAPQQLTHLQGGVANLKASPAGTHLAFTRDIKLDPTVAELFEDLPKADARIIDSLLYRHWNQWHDYAYSHVHVAPFGPEGNLQEPIDLMRGLRADCPLPPFGGSEHFAFSPDGRELAMTIKLVNNPAESTDSSIFISDIAGGSLRNLSPGMPGYDTTPLYSPDGKYLAWESMVRAGFESDRNRILLFERDSGRVRELTQGLDQTAHHPCWSEDSQFVYFDSEHRGTTQVYRLRAEGGQLEPISRGRFDFRMLGMWPAGNAILVAQQSMLRATELACIELDSGRCTTVTGENESHFSELELPAVEERWVRGSDGAQIHNWVILPPGFDPQQRYPMLVYCQGGPQGQIGQWFSYRWNFHLMAAKGYIVLAVNRRGLPGFGRPWNDQISGDWGGQAMQDILAATDALRAEPYVDGERVGAVGASFGGYTVYYLMGHHADRFAAMIAHCGVFNLESMYGSTEEIFFPNWDLGGPYWRSSAARALYDAFSPHRFVGNWRTPLLVIHGEKDFRVPVTQGMEAFTAAQLEGVPSRFLYFPNEGHWVSSPQNSVLWQRVFFGWLEKYLD